MVRGGKLKSYDRNDERSQEENSPESDRFPENEDTQKNRPNGTNTCPDGISGSRGYGLGASHRFEQQKHT